MKLLLLYGAQADIGDVSGHTPLHLAAASSAVGVVRLLLGLGGADPSLRDNEGMAPLGLAKGREVEAMLMAAPYQAYYLKKLRCIIGMGSGASEEEGEGREEEALEQQEQKQRLQLEEEGGTQDGGDGEKKDEEGEARVTSALPSSIFPAVVSSPGLPRTRTESRVQTAAAEEVGLSVRRCRRALKPPRPMPRVDFHHSGEEEEKEEDGKKSGNRRHDASEPVGRGVLPVLPDLAARVLEEAVRRMNADLFVELLDLLWPWGVGTG